MSRTTDPQDELLTQVDEQNQVVGGIARREAHQKGGIYYRTIFVLIINQNHEVYVQKRSATKDLYPNRWDLSVGGHVKYGSAYEDTAISEVEEELGLSVEKKDLIVKGYVLVKLKDSNEYFKVFEYLLKAGQEIITSSEEIRDSKWMTIGQIKQSMTDNSLQWYERPEQVIAALY